MELRKYVAEILDDLRMNGEESLRKYMAEFDRYDGDIFPTEEEWGNAGLITEKEKETFKRIIDRIYDFHNREEKSEFAYVKNGSLYGMKEVAINRVGLYIPGGKPLPSTLIMTVIPALLAGVSEIVVCTPPVNGKIRPEILYLAEKFNIGEIYKIGGVQAIAAMTYGICMKKVDKIFGPGNSYVNEAKRQVFGDVGIDSLAGPSEICVIADEYADAEYILYDLMSQREHGNDSKAWLLTTSETLAEYCEDDLIEVLKFNTVEECIEKSNEIAPEHLEINVENPLVYLESIKNAGAVYFGQYTPVPCADYFLGTNHVLPTGSSARFSSVLTVDDFRKRMAYSFLTKNEFMENRELGITMAGMEGLEYHGKSLKVRK